VVVFVNFWWLEFYDAVYLIVHFVCVSCLKIKCHPMWVQTCVLLVLHRNKEIIRGRKKKPYPVLKVESIEPFGRSVNRRHNTSRPSDNVLQKSRHFGTSQYPITLENDSLVLLFWGDRSKPLSEEKFRSCSNLV
jgi:hypothetical protein